MPTHVRLGSQQGERVVCLFKEPKGDVQAGFFRQVIYVRVQFEARFGLYSVLSTHFAFDVAWRSINRCRFSAQKRSSASIASPEFSPSRASASNSASAA